MEVSCGLFVPKTSSTVNSCSSDKEAIVQGPTDDMTYRSFTRHPASLNANVGAVYPGLSALQNLASNYSTSSRNLHLPQPRTASLVAAEKKFQWQRQGGRASSDDGDDGDAAESSTTGVDTTFATMKEYSCGFDTVYLENPSTQVDRGYYSAVGTASQADSSQKKNMTSPSNPSTSKASSWKRTMKSNRVPSPQTDDMSSNKDLTDLGQIPQDRLPPSKKDHSRLLTPFQSSQSPSVNPSTQAIASTKSIGTTNPSSQLLSLNRPIQSSYPHPTAKASSRSSHLLHLASMQSVARSSAAAATLGQRAMLFGSASSVSASAPKSSTNTMIDTSYVYMPPDATIFLPPGALSASSKSSSQIRVKKTSSLPSSSSQLTMPKLITSQSSVYKPTLSATSALATYQTQSFASAAPNIASTAAAYNREILSSRPVSSQSAIARVKSSASGSAGTAIYRAPSSVKSSASSFMVAGKKTIKQATTKPASLIRSDTQGNATATVSTIVAKVEPAALSTSDAETKKRPISAVVHAASCDPEPKRANVKDISASNSSSQATMISEESGNAAEG